MSKCQGCLKVNVLFIEGIRLSAPNSSADRTNDAQQRCDWSVSGKNVVDKATTSRQTAHDIESNRDGPANWRHFFEHKARHPHLCKHAARHNVQPKHLFSGAVITFSAWKWWTWLQTGQRILRGRLCPEEWVASDGDGWNPFYLPSPNFPPHPSRWASSKHTTPHKG